MPKLDDTQTEVMYGKAEEVLGQTAQALHAQAMMAYNERTSNDAMRIMSFVWGRNARHLGRAVVRWPQDFMGVDGTPPPVLEPDEFQVLFMLAALPREAAEDLRVKWRRYSWRAWRVRQAVEDWREEQKDPKLLRLRASGKVNVVVGAGGRDTLTIDLDPIKGGLKPEWAGRKVTMLLTEVKEA